MIQLRRAQTSSLASSATGDPETATQALISVEEEELTCEETDAALRGAGECSAAHGRTGVFVHGVVHIWGGWSTGSMGGGRPCGEACVAAVLCHSSRGPRYLCHAVPHRVTLRLELTFWRTVAQDLLPLQCPLS